MTRFLAVLFLISTNAFFSTAQSPCNKSWLTGQRAVTTTVSWDEFTGPLAKLHKSHYMLLPSDVTQNFSVPLAIGYRYTVLFYTDASALATGVEIFDPQGLRLEFEKVYGKVRNNAIELTLEPAYSGNYTFAVRGIFKSDKASCAALLVREWDEVEWEERLELLGITE